NLRGQVYRHYDTAGIVTTIQVDSKGNTLQGSRQLLKNYKDNADWNKLAETDLEPTLYTTVVAFDALNRPVQVQTPDNIITRPVYNAAGILNQVFVRIKGAAETQFVKDISYDAKGQRQSISLG